MTTNYADLYQTMLTIRLLEDRLQAKCDIGEAGDLHFNKGQEAIAVGACEVLERTDHIVTHHRTIAHQVAKATKIYHQDFRDVHLYQLVAELLGRRTGTCGGRAGEMHISDPAIRHDFSFQLVGTCIPVATGIAWSLKNWKKLDEVVAVFFGDASSSNGQFHEGLSIAAIHKLPMIFICENNRLAGNIRPQHYMPTQTVSERVAGYGIYQMQADGNNIDAVMSAVRDARNFCPKVGPVFLECDTTRLCWHKQGQRDARPPEEIAKEAERDPLPRMASRIQPEEARIIEARVNAILDEVFLKVDSDPPPEVFHD